MTSPVDVMIVVAYHLGARCPSENAGLRIQKVMSSPGFTGYFWVIAFCSFELFVPAVSQPEFDIRNREGASVCLEQGGHGCWEFAKGKIIRWGVLSHRARVENTNNTTTTQFNRRRKRGVGAIGLDQGCFI